MTPSDFALCVPLINLEIERLRSPAMRRIKECTHVDLVRAEVWLSHLDELYVGEPGLPEDCARPARLVAIAVREIYDFLTRDPSNWAPGIWRPRALHRAVDHMIRIRIQAGGGGCEACHADVPLELHHLHYRNFGYELPSDIVRLCRDCHEARHRVYGLPKNLSWQDGWEWPIPDEGGRDVGSGEKT